MFGFRFNLMETFPLFVIQCVPKRDSDGLIRSQNQLTRVLSWHIRESGVFARVKLTSALTVQLPKSQKPLWGGIRNGGNRSPSGFCVCVRLWRPLSFDWHDLLPDWTHSQQHRALTDSTAEQESKNNTHTPGWKQGAVKHRSTFLTTVMLENWVNAVPQCSRNAAEEPVNSHSRKHDNKPSNKVNLKHATLKVTHV